MLVTRLCGPSVPEKEKALAWMLGSTRQIWVVLYQTILTAPR